MWQTHFFGRKPPLFTFVKLTSQQSCKGVLDVFLPHEDFCNIYNHFCLVFYDKSTLIIIKTMVAKIGEDLLYSNNLTKPFMSIAHRIHSIPLLGGCHYTHFYWGLCIKFVKTPLPNCQLQRKHSFLKVIIIIPHIIFCLIFIKYFHLFSI